MFSSNDDTLTKFQLAYFQVTQVDISHGMVGRTGLCCNLSELGRCIQQVRSERSWLLVVGVVEMIE